MNSTNELDRAAGVAVLLGDVRRKGVRLWSRDGQLHFKAPKGVLTREELARLSACRVELIAMLEKAAEGALDAEPLEPRRDPSHAPLTFSQLAHWYLHSLAERPSSRYVSCAIRLKGHLDIAALQASLAEAYRRHDALRTTIVVVDGVPRQHIASGADTFVLPIHDLTHVPPDSRDEEVTRRFEEHVLRPIKVTEDALFDAQLLEVAPDDHVLTLAMEHIISDGVSVNVLLRDVLALYQLASRGQPLVLPKVAIQFADYAVWQRKSHEAWMKAHGAYWSERTARYRRSRFPHDAAASGAGIGLGNEGFEIDRQLKAKLREWCRGRATTMVMAVFTAYAALVLRWCGTQQAVLRYQTDGRLQAEIQDAIGYFAFPLYFFIETTPTDRLADLLGRVTREYCEAFEHADASFLEAQVPRPDLTRTSSFNWLAQEPKGNDFRVEEVPSGLECSRVPFRRQTIANYELDSEPMIGLLDTAEEIRGFVQYPIDRFLPETMQRFARNMVRFVRVLVSEPDTRVSDIELV